jgi:hypothetical protein
MRGAVSLGLLDWTLNFFTNQGFVDVRDDSASSDCGLDQAVQLFITTDSLKDEMTKPY